MGSRIPHKNVQTRLFAIQYEVFRLLVGIGYHLRKFGRFADVDL